ncbi:glycosyltransferase family 4 protein [Frankia sp. CNm7]|uniref:Glycosyltransferase family 4 protein n=1 Tax=Frankia nepalensis TaxID=1836974 RepID=A0A937RHT8_9ACTN|nr:glycosyltransferase family 4 protein [Frankia nepalensis]MBL7498563.1 glycosyltransferase family 4 protein [Frankia nepalensis]MBL7513764.1 glycosyltransferase family 4 protein [Frankia nepalensis]MBL7524240.1 glycosyltransferase family 4 protein [Frankia nepalensis]MBL7626276.1 glycosyltransferase family 4 protein [Frankia nepalensis]
MERENASDDGRMLVTFLCEQYPPVVWDGAGIYTAVLASALATLGHDVHVICAQGHKVVDEQVDGVHVHRRPLLRVPVSRFLGKYARYLTGPNYPRDSLALRASLTFSYALYLRRLGLKPDVIETQDGETRALMQVVDRSCPIVVHMHAPTMLTLRLTGPQLSVRGRIADRLDRITSDHATMVTAPSQLLVDTVRPYGWLSRQDVKVVPNPFDATPWLDVPSVSRTGPVIATVGRLEPNKGIDVLLDALALLAARGVDAKLILAGSPSGHIDGVPTGRWLERRAQELDVPVVFTGHIGQRELADVYGQARVVAVPSRFESFSIAAVEGMASGRPVVTTTRTGIAPFIREWEAGTVVAAEDPGALADALVPFLTDPGLAEAVGANGRAGAARLDPLRIAQDREAVYREAISRFRRDRPAASHTR